MLLTTLITIGVALCIWLLRKWRFPKSPTLNKDDDEIAINLGPIHHLGYQQNLSTLTWYSTSIKDNDNDNDTPTTEDNAAIVTLLQSRMKQILQLNPWMTGYIVHCRNNVCLVHSQKFQTTVVHDDEDDDNEEMNNHPYLVIIDPSQSTLSRHDDNIDTRSSIDQLTKQVQKYTLLFQPPPQNTSTNTTTTTIKEKHEKKSLRVPLFQVTIVPCCKNPKTNFAMIVTMSPFLGDGSTYYKLYDMVVGTTPIIPLVYHHPKNNNNESSTRRRSPRSIDSRTTFLLNQMSGMIMSKINHYSGGYNFADSYRLQSHILWIDETKLLLLLQEQQEQNHNDDDENENDEEKGTTRNCRTGSDDDHCYDILSSWWFQQTNCSLGLLSIDRRRRRRSHDDEDHQYPVGNYTHSIFYRRSDSKTLIQMKQIRINQLLLQQQSSTTTTTTTTTATTIQEKKEQQQNNHLPAMKQQQQSRLRRRELLFGTIARVTNWAMYKTTNQHHNHQNKNVRMKEEEKKDEEEVEDEKEKKDNQNRNKKNSLHFDYQEELHLPLYNIQQYGTTTRCDMIVFRSGLNNKQLGILCVGTKHQLQNIITSTGTGTCTGCSSSAATTTGGVAPPSFVIQHPL